MVSQDVLGAVFRIEKADRSFRSAPNCSSKAAAMVEGIGGLFGIARMDYILNTCAANSRNRPCKKLQEVSATGSTSTTCINLLYFGPFCPRRPQSLNCQ